MKAQSSCCQIKNSDTFNPYPSLCSQPTKEPAGVHQSLRREATREAHLRAEGCSVVPAGRHLYRRDWCVPISGAPQHLN